MGERNAMKYEKVVEGRFIQRPNRFVAQVEIQGKREWVHVKNTGRCKELLIPGVTVYLEDFRHRMGKRKMAYSLISVQKKDLLINIDSQSPNKVVEEAFHQGKIFLPDMGMPETVIREKTFGDSRFDFYVEDGEGNRGYVEVKGVTLEVNGKGYFPDAPTLRGIKHIKGLTKAVEEGYKAYLIFIVQTREVDYVAPNDHTQPEFRSAMEQGRGIHYLAYNCHIKPDALWLGRKIQVEEMNNI